MSDQDTGSRKLISVLSSAVPFEPFKCSLPKISIVENMYDSSRTTNGWCNPTLLEVHWKPHHRWRWTKALCVSLFCFSIVWLKDNAGTIKIEPASEHRIIFPHFKRWILWILWDPHSSKGNKSCVYLEHGPGLLQVFGILNHLQVCNKRKGRYLLHSTQHLAMD